MPSIQVLDALGATQTVQTVPAVGRAAAAASLPMALATDDSTNLAAIATAAQDTTTPSPIKSTDLGTTADTAATTDSGTFSLIALTKRLLGKIPAALGRVSAANSLGIALSTEDKAALDQLHADLIAATPAGTAIVGKVGIDQSTPGTTNGVSVTNASLAVTAAALPLPTGASADATLAAQSAKLPATLGAKAGAASLSTVAASDDYARLPAISTNYLPASAATNNLTQIKATAGAIKSIQGYNAKASAVYLKLFGLPSAGVTAGTTAAIKSLYIPASSAFVFDFPTGYAPSGGTGLSFMLTTGGALADNTAIAAGDILALNVDYI